MKQKIDKQNVLVLVLILLAVSAFCLNVEFDINDELWNFSNVYKMSIGFEIYKDLNVIITPLFFYIGQLLFKVLGANYFVFRIYNILIATMFYYLTYKLFNVLKMDRKLSKIYLIICILVTCPLITQGANYNILVVNFVLLGIIFYIKHQKNSIKNNIIQGILLFLVFLTKQNVGAFYVLGLIIIKVLEILQDKQKIKSKFLDLVSIASVFLTLVALFALYLLATNNLYNAINFAFLGMGEFTTNYLNSAMIYNIPTIFIFALVAFSAKSKKINMNNSKKHDLKILISFAIPMLGMQYPLFNRYHFTISIYLTIIVLLYLLDTTFLSELLSEVKYNKILKLGTISLVVIFFICGIINFAKKYKYYDYTHPYYGSNIKQEQIQYLENICNYINEKGNVKIISRKANYFMNILKKSNGILDLAFKGNLGLEGEQGLIQTIQNQENAIILIDNDEEFNICSQDSILAREYIKNNYNFIGEIEDFLIYERSYNE